jgi:hypothetical protein
MKAMRLGSMIILYIKWVSKMSCSKCGGDIIGDGYTSPMHCEYAEYDGIECDAGIVECDFEED